MKELKLNIDTFAIKEVLLNLVVPIVSFLVTALLAVFVLYPSFTSSIQSGSDLESKQVLTATLEGKLKTLSRLLDFKSVVEEDAKLVGNLLAGEPKVPQLLTQIDLVAKESGLTISRLTYTISDSGAGKEKETEVLPFKYVVVSMGATGTYNQLVNFFKILENSARLIDIESFRFSADDEQPSVFGISMVLRSPYMYVESSAVTDDPLTLDITDTEFLNLIAKIKNFKVYNISESEINTTLLDATVNESTPTIP